MKIVCMCRGGNCRSVACAYLLKYKYGQDALACGWEGNTLETRHMLFDWADAVIVMQMKFLEFVPERFLSKAYVVDVGEDIWFNSFHPDLLNKCEDLLSKIVVKL